MSQKSVKKIIEEMASQVQVIGPAKVGPESQEEECPTCGGLGFYTVDVEPDHPAFGRSIPCNCQEAIRAARLWRASGLLPAERDWRMEYISTMPGKIEAYKLAKAILEQDPPVGWLVVYGPYGMGKSGLIKASVAEAVRAGVPAYYRRAEDILAEARASFDDPSGREIDVKAKYAKVQLLAVDEVDRVSMTDWSRSFLFTLMDERYNRRSQIATMMATNKKVGEMGADWGYLESRMADGLIAGIAGIGLRNRGE